MPFTLAHPSIVIPFKQYKPEYFSLTALILGSMAPDIEYFLFLRPMSPWGGHSPLGILYVGLPVCLLLAVIFHEWVREGLQPLLPQVLFERVVDIPSPDYRSLKAWGVFLSSYLIGAWSHLLWDSWTHYDGFFVNYIQFLQQPLIPNFSPHLSWFRFIQHVSSMLGLGFVALLFILWFRKAKKNSSAKSPLSTTRKVFYLALILFFGFAGGTKSMFDYGALLARNSFGVRRSLVCFVCGGIAFLVVGAIVVGFIVRFRLDKAKGEEERGEQRLRRLSFGEPQG